MKKLIIAVVVLLSATTLFAQTDSMQTSNSSVITPAQGEPEQKQKNNKVEQIVEKIKDVKKEQCRKFNEEDKPIRTLLGGGKSKGGYIGFSFNHSLLNGQDAIGSGMRLGWIKNHYFSMGFFGTGFASSPYLQNTLPEHSIDLAGGYGGIFFEPMLFPLMPVHLSFPINIGIGGVSMMDSYYSHDYEYDYYVEEVGVFSVVEPGIELEANVFKHMRIAFDMSYRKAFGLTMHNVDNDIIDGLSYGFTVKFGKF